MLSNMCGHFVLGYMESEMGNHLASAGRAHQLAFAWHHSVSALLVEMLVFFRVAMRQ